MGRGQALHIEHRIPGADANFYLAIAGIVASGLYGIEHELEPIGEPMTDGTSTPGEPLPRSLRAALERFDKSARARELLGPEIVDHLLAVGRQELEVFDREVTDIERRRLFQWA
jgi:glutamine synthetase